MGMVFRFEHLSSLVLEQNNELSLPYEQKDGYFGCQVNSSSPMRRGCQTRFCSSETDRFEVKKNRKVSVHTLRTDHFHAKYQTNPSTLKTEKFPFTCCHYTS